MMTLTAALGARGLATTRLTTCTIDRLSETMRPLGFDPRDCAGVSLIGISPDEGSALYAACGENVVAATIVSASESDGTRLAIVGDELRLLAA